MSEWLKASWMSVPLDKWLFVKIENVPLPTIARRSKFTQKYERADTGNVIMDLVTHWQPVVFPVPPKEDSKQVAQLLFASESIPSGERKEGFLEAIEYVRLMENAVR